MSLLHSATSKFVVREGGNTRNKQSQLATATLLHDKLHENVARITGPLRPRVRNYVISIHLFKAYARSATNGSDNARNICE